MITDAQVNNALTAYYGADQKYDPSMRLTLEKRMRTALAAAQAGGLTEGAQKCWEWKLGHNEGFAEGIEAAAMTARMFPYEDKHLTIPALLMAIMDAIRALRPPAAPADTSANYEPMEPEENWAGIKRGTALGYGPNDPRFPSASAPTGAQQEFRQKVNDEALAVIERWSGDGKLTLTLSAMEDLAEQIADAVPLPAPAAAPSENARIHWQDHIAQEVILTGPHPYGPPLREDK